MLYFHYLNPLIYYLKKIIIYKLFVPMELIIKAKNPTVIHKIMIVNTDSNIF